MKNGTHEVVARIFRSSGALAAVLAVTLFSAGAARAQSSSLVPASAGQATTAKTAVEPASPTPTASGAQAEATASTVSTSPAVKTAETTKGSHEGIVVHGHWFIEVKNPDGTVSSRSEFENALDPNEGADVMTGLLSGEYTPAGFYINLQDAAGGGDLCTFGNCTLYDNRTAVCTPSFLQGGLCGPLTYTPNSGGPVGNAVGYTLSGAVVPAVGGTINSVSSGVVACYPVASFTSKNPPFVGNENDPFSTGNAVGSTAFVGLSPGQQGSSGCKGGANTSALFNLTSTKIAAQTVVTGQSVSATVIITFSSK